MTVTKATTAEQGTGIAVAKGMSDQDSTRGSLVLNEDGATTSVKVLAAGSVKRQQNNRMNDTSTHLLPEDETNTLPRQSQGRELSSDTFSTRPIFDSLLTINPENAPTPSHDGSSDAGGGVSIEIVRYRNDETAKNAGNPSQSVSARTIQCGNTDNDKKETPELNPNSLQRFRQSCGEIVNHPLVQNFIILMICFNALTMGIATLDAVEDSDDARQAFETLDMVFLIIFTIELAMQLVYHGKNLFLDGWLFFDFFVVVMSWSFDSLQIVRAFRIFRAFRLISRLQSLRSVILSLGQAAPSLGAVTFILILVLYIFAVLCTELFGETVLDDEYFNRLDNSLFTLLEMMTLEWADVARQVIDQHSWAWAVFVPFLVITNFALFSLVVAVVCDGVTVTEHGEHEDPAITRQRVTDLRKQVRALTKNQDAIAKALREALQKLEGNRGKEDRGISTSSKR